MIILQPNHYHNLPRAISEPLTAFQSKIAPMLESYQNGTLIGFDGQMVLTSIEDALSGFLHDTTESYYDDLIAIDNVTLYPECVFPIRDVPDDDTIQSLLAHVPSTATVIVRSRKVKHEADYVTIPFREATPQDFIKAYNELCERFVLLNT